MGEKSQPRAQELIEKYLRRVELDEKNTAKPIAYRTRWENIYGKSN